MLNPPRYVQKPFEEREITKDTLCSLLNLGVYPSGSFIAFTLFFNIIPQRGSLPFTSFRTPFTHLQQVFTSSFLAFSKRNMSSTPFVVGM
jgi:hypothetical protein